MSFNINSFVDLHTHILYGIDDGSSSLEESICIAKSLVKAGVKRVVATPHFIPGTAWAAPKKKIIEMVTTLQNELVMRNLDLQVAAGMEIAYHTNLPSRLENKEVLPLGESDYYLIEPSFHGEQDSLLNCLSRLLKEDFKIILAHPERIDGLRDKFDQLVRLVEQGMLCQITAGSLLGTLGQEPKASAIKLWNKGAVHLIASDVHDVKRRPCITSQEWLQLQEDEIFNKILVTCNTNIRKIFTH